MGKFVDFLRFRQATVLTQGLAWGCVGLGAIALLALGRGLGQPNPDAMFILWFWIEGGFLLLGLSLGWAATAAQGVALWRSPSTWGALGGLGAGIVAIYLQFTLELSGAGVPTWAIAIATLNVLLLGGALLLLNYGRWYGLAQSLAWGAFLLALLVLMGYCYQVPGFYFRRYGAVIVMTALADLGLALGVWARCPERGWLAVLTSPYAGGKTARRLLPLIVGLPLVLGAINLQLQTYSHNSLSDEILVLIRSLLNILLFGGTTWWIARSLNHSDRQHRCMEGDLRQLNATLTEQVLQRTAELTATNRQLEENYQLLVNVINGISDPVFVKDRQGRLVLVNESMAQKFGKTVDEIVGLTDFDLHPPEVAQVLSDRDFAFMAQATVQNLEEQVPHGGEVLTFLTTKNPWRDRDGQVIGLIAVAKEITDRKRAELALQTSERRLRAIIDSEPECVKITTATGELLEMNAAGLAMIEADSLEQVRGTQTSHLVLDSYRAEFLAALAQAAQGESTICAYEIQGLKGTRRWLEAHAVPFPALDDQPPQVLSVTRDISDRKRAETALRHREWLTRFFLEHTPIPAAVVDTEMRYLMVSHQWRTEYRLGDQPLIGRSHYEVFPDLPDHWREIHQRCLAGAIDTAAEQPFLRTDGELDWISWTVRPWYAENGAIGGLIMFTEVVTQRKRAEIELRQSQQQYASLALAAPVGIFRTTPDGDCVYVNDRWCELAGMPMEAALGAGWVSAIHPDDRDYVFMAWYTAAQHNLLFREELRFQRPDGASSWVFVQATAERNSAGEVVGYVGTVTDISDRKQVETALKESEERLRLALSASQQGLYDHNLRTNRTIVSAEYAQMLGYAPEELDETTELWRDRLHPDERDRVFQVYEDYITGKRPDYKVEFQQRTKTGQWNWVLSVGQIVAWDEQGQPLRMIGTHTDIGDRKRAEAELRESEERLRLALEAANQGLFDWNIQTNTVIVSAEYARMLGYDPDEFQENPQAWLERLHPEEREPISQICQDYITGKRPDYKVEFRLRTKAGKWKWILSVGKIVAWDEAGQPLRMIGTHTDISDRKRAEQERRRAEQLRVELGLLETILDSVLAGYWYEDCRTGHSYWSAGMKQMFGYTDEELPTVANLWQQLIFPEDLPRVAANFEQHVQSQGQIPYYNEVRYRHKDGSTVWVICAGRVIEWDSAGQPLYVIGCHVDITPLKQVEAQLQKSDTHLKLAQRIGNLGSWEFNPSTGEIAWSEQVFRIFGRSPDLGTPDFDTIQSCFHPDDRDEHHRTLETAIATATPYELETRIYRPDQTLVYLQIKGQPICDSDGTLLQLIGTVLDITERKQAEAKILTTATQLEAANRELEAFSYSVSHDLRAPLRGIDGFSKALVERYSDRLDEKGLHYLSRIRNGTQRMGELIDDLLILSRVTRADMQKITVNLSELVHVTTSELMGAIPERAVEWVIAPDITAFGDPRLLRIALENLLNNALKFTSNKTQTHIEFGVRVEDNTAQPIYFVKDNGAGFDMAYGDRLFKPFQRLHSEREFPGTGIGLATIARIIQRHGGLVWAEGILDEGATFYFTLPS